MIPACEVGARDGVGLVLQEPGPGRKEARFWNSVPRRADFSLTSPLLALTEDAGCWRVTDQMPDFSLTG